MKLLSHKGGKKCPHQLSRASTTNLWHINEQCPITIKLQNTVISGHLQKANDILCKTNLNALSLRVPRELPQNFISSLFYQDKFWTHKCPKKRFSERAFLPTVSYEKMAGIQLLSSFLFSSLHLEILSQRPSPHLLVDFSILLISLA